MDTLFEDDVHAKELIDLSRKVHEDNERLQAEVSRLRVALCQSDALNAWAAGLFEGEGSVRYDRTCVRIALTMCDEDVVRRWGEAVGAGKIYGPYPPRGTGTKPQWQWTVQKLIDVEAVYIRLYPWLGSRRMQQFDDAWQKYRAAREPAAAPSAALAVESGVEECPECGSPRLKEIHGRLDRYCENCQAEFSAAAPSAAPGVEEEG